MYNQQFLDTVDKINSIAKAMGFTNGVTWARKQLEDGIINEYTFEFFSSCHDLRNLIAHGYAMDINITAATLQKAQLFLKAISNPLGNTTALLLNAAKINTNAHLEIQVGDFIIVMQKTRSYYETPKGILFRVVEVTRTTVIMENLNTKDMYDINRLRKDSNLDLENGLYVFKNNPLGFALSGNTQLVIVGHPFLDKGIARSPFISFQYVTYNPGAERNFSSSDYKKVTCRGYLAHIQCIEPYRNKQLLDFTTGNIDEYLERKPQRYTEQADDDLPF